MPYLNRIEIIAEVKTSPSYKTITHGRTSVMFQAETRQTWIDDDGQEHARAELHYVVLIGKAADAMSRAAIQAGDLVYLAGRMQYRPVQDSAGREIIRAEILADLWQLL